MSLHLNPILRCISFGFSNPCVSTYSAIFGYVPHEESSKLEQRKRDHADDLVKVACMRRKELPFNCPKSAAESSTLQYNRDATSLHAHDLFLRSNFAQT